MLVEVQEDGGFNIVCDRRNVDGKSERETKPQEYERVGREEEGRTSADVSVAAP